MGEDPLLSGPVRGDYGANEWEERSPEGLRTFGSRRTKPRTDPTLRGPVG